MRKFARVDGVAPPALRAAFEPVARWAEWMPGLEKARVVEEGPARVVVDVEQRMLGRRIAARLEVGLEPLAVRQRQLAGWARRWEATWRFAPTPDATGSSVSLFLDLELGLLGRLIPVGRIEAEVERRFRETVAAAAATARRTSSDVSPAKTPGEGEALLELWETPTGLELILRGRRYRLTPLDP